MTKQPLIPPRTLQEVAAYLAVFADDAVELCSVIVAAQARHVGNPQLCAVLNRLEHITRDYALGFANAATGVSSDTRALLWPSVEVVR